MRPIWKGTITFGLVTIPVGLYSDDRDPRFRSRRRHRLRVLTETLRKAIEATRKARRPHKVVNLVDALRKSLEKAV